MRSEMHAPIAGANRICPLPSSKITTPEGCQHCRRPDACRCWRSEMFNVWLAQGAQSVSQGPISKERAEAVLQDVFFRNGPTMEKYIAWHRLRIGVKCAAHLYGPALGFQSLCGRHFVHVIQAVRSLFLFWGSDGMLYPQLPLANVP